MAVIYNSQLDAFELYHQIQEDNGPSKNVSSATASAVLRALSDGLSGSAGAAISNVATYPLDLIITRLQIQRQLRKDVSKASAEEYTSFRDATRKIMEKDGWQGFYTGLVSDTGKTILDSFLFFLMYDFMRKQRLRRGGQNRTGLPALEELGVGFVAGSLTKLCTTPIANIVTRKQAAAFTSTNPSAAEIAKSIMEEKGVGGFWSGYSASLVLTLNPSLTFFLFESLKRILLPRSKRDNPPPSATFLLAAISKACASSVTYPFSLAKARLQAGSMKKEGQDEEVRDKKTIDQSLPAGPKTKSAARQTIFSTLYTIAHNEGLPALYEGIHLEIVKAFFSHGTTMLVRQAIQRLLVKFYYILRMVLSPLTGSQRSEERRKRLAAKAQKSGHEYYDLAIRRTSEKMEDVKKATEEAAVEAARRAKEAAKFVAEYVDEEADDGEGLSGTAGIARWLDGRDK